MNRIFLVGLIVFTAFVASDVCADSETAFAPRISDFEVTFSGKPKHTEFETLSAEGETLKCLRAELRMPDSFQRVEVIPMPPGFSSVETKESAITKMKEYATHNGLRAPEFTWEFNALGKRLSMRATKVLDDNGKARAVTYETVAHYGDSSLLMIYVGGPSESYPQTRVVNFLKSVKKNNRK